MATKVKKGDLIVYSKPFAYKLYSKFRGLRCETCLDKNSSLKKCTKCKTTFYCNKECQIAGWSVHKHECGNTSKLLKHDKLLHPDNEFEVIEKMVDWVVLIYRVIHKLQNGGDKESEKIGNVIRTFADLESHSEEIKRDLVRLRVVKSTAFRLGRFFPQTEKSYEEILDIAGKVMINSLMITDNITGDILGTGVYLGPSVLNHSCHPNALFVFDGPCVMVRSVEDLPDMDVSKIFLPYIGTLDIKSVRQKTLLKQYYFTCNCDWCKDDVMDKKMMSVRCENGKCSEAVYIHSDKCKNCGTLMNLEKLAAAREVPNELEEACMKATQLLNELNHPRHKQPKGAMRILNPVMDKAERLLHPLFNIAYLKAAQVAWDICQTTRDDTRSISYGLATLNAYRKYLSDVHPICLRNLITLGGLQLRLGNKKEAISNNEEALHIATTLHGENHKTTLEIRSYLFFCYHEN